MADFDWKDDEDAIVLGWQPRTAVYANGLSGGRGVVIRQEIDPYLQDDRGDDVVYLTPMGAVQIAWRLIEAAHECGIPIAPRKLMTQPLDLGPKQSPIPLTHPEPVHPEAGPLLKAMETGPDGEALPPTAANPSGRKSPKVAAE